MARGSKDYDKVTHAASSKDSKGKQKAVWDMVGSKKKLHEMVEALINGDSKAAAASLHDYLQVKTRTVLGETDEEGMEFGDEHEHEDHEDGDDEMKADRHEDGEECAECGCDPCECEGSEHDGEEGDEDFDADKEFGGEGDEGHEEMHEGARGSAVADDSSVRTKMKKNSMGAKDLVGTVKGKNNFNKSSGNGTKSDSSGERKTAMKKNSMGAKDLESKVKGNIKFDTKGKAKLTKPFNNAAPGLDRKIKGDIKF